MYNPQQPRAVLCLPGYAPNWRGGVGGVQDKLKWLAGDVGRPLGGGEPSPTRFYCSGKCHRVIMLGDVLTLRRPVRTPPWRRSWACLHALRRAERGALLGGAAGVAHHALHDVRPAPGAIAHVRAVEHLVLARGAGVGVLRAEQGDHSSENQFDRELH